MLYDIITILFIAFLEGILSLDNAVVLAVLVKPLPEKDRKKALTYGIWGAFIFRAVALTFITHIVAMPWLRFIGGAYLVFIATKQFYGVDSDKKPNATVHGSFLMTVVMVELMDIVFSIDSILAAVGISQTYWIVLCGGIIGIVMMRFAARIFIKLLGKFPGLETSAYLLILIIGCKLLAEYFGFEVHSQESLLSWAFWVFSGLSLAYGFLNQSTKKEIA